MYSCHLTPINGVKIASSRQYVLGGVSPPFWIGKSGCDAEAPPLMEGSFTGCHDIVEDVCDGRSLSLWYRQ